MNLRRRILGTGDYGGAIAQLVGTAVDAGLSVYSKSVDAKASKYQAEINQKTLSLAADRQKAEARQLLALEAARAAQASPKIVNVNTTNFTLVAAVAAVAAVLLLK
jgi:hypothetical protein